MEVISVRRLVDRRGMELKRKSNFELFRIVAMCLIILIHLLSAADSDSFGLTGRFGGLFGAGVVGICNMGVTCFCLISGYFGMKFSVKKLLKLEAMMITCSLLETAMLVLVFPQEMQGAALLEQVLKSLIPFASRKYWFYSCYICIFLLSGFIQKFIDMLKKEELERFLAILVVVFSILPTLFYFEIMQDTGKGLVQMFMLYLIGRYIRMYRDVPVSRWKAAVLFMGLWIANTISMAYPLRVGSIIHSLCRDNSITNILMAVALLYLFKDMNISSKWINAITVNMFAVFALENSVTDVFAKYIKQGVLYSENQFVAVLFMLGTVVAIFAVCTVVGWIRELLLGKAENKLIDMIDKKISTWRNRRV